MVLDYQAFTLTDIEEEEEIEINPEINPARAGGQVWQVRHRAAGARLRHDAGQSPSPRALRLPDGHGSDLDKGGRRAPRVRHHIAH